MTESVHLQSDKVTLDSSKDKHPLQSTSRGVLLESTCPPKFKQSLDTDFYHNHVHSLYTTELDVKQPPWWFSWTFIPDSCQLLPLNCGKSRSFAVPVTFSKHRKT